jgi:hypothetical protein
MSRLEQPDVSEYPITSKDGSTKVLDAETIYKFTDPDKKSGRWLAVLTIQTSWKDTEGKQTTKVNVRILRWEYRALTKWDNDQKKRVPTGEYGWVQEQDHSVNKKTVWDKTVAAVDEQLGALK